MSKVQETKELVSFVGGGINAGVKIGADGEVKLQEIIGELGLFLSAQEAFQGVNKINAEQALAGIEQKQEQAKAFSERLKDLKELDAYDVGKFGEGVLSIWGFIARRTADQIAARINQNGLPMSTLENGELTGAQLLSA